MDTSTPRPADDAAGAGGPAPTRAACAARIEAFGRIEAPDTGGRRAAVALALVSDDAGTRLLLTGRPSTMRAHAGQYALPGGGVDAGETVEQAAIRELAEELGVRVPADDVLGLLDDYVTRSGYVVTPVVVWVGELREPITPNPDEVAVVFEVTMAEVDVDPLLEPVPGAPADALPMLLWPFRGGVMHAPTAAIVHQFREVVIHGRDTRVAGYAQPDFAAR